MMAQEERGKSEGDNAIERALSCISRATNETSRAYIDYKTIVKLT